MGLCAWDFGMRFPPDNSDWKLRNDKASVILNNNSDQTQKLHFGLQFMTEVERFISYFPPTEVY